VVAPHRAQLATAARDGRLALLRARWPQLLGEAWEDLCRWAVPTLGPQTRVGTRGPWGPPSRWWHGAAPEWDLVARSLDGRRLLLGEAKVAVDSIPAARAALQARPPPAIDDLDGLEQVRVLFVARATGGDDDVISAAQVFSPAR
jgi:hypothetical protein